MTARELVKVDWLTLVFPVSDDIEQMTIDKAKVLLAFIGFPPEWEIYKLDHGMYRYSNAYNMVDKSTFLAFDDSSIMIQMSGAGVDNLSAVIRERDLTIIDVIRTATEDLNAHVTRIDVAVDFINVGIYYSPYFLNEEAEKGSLVSRASRIKFVKSYSTDGASNNMNDLAKDLKVGGTFYIGTNPFQFRAYDKRAERAQKVGLLDPNIDSWYRWEFQINGDQADNFIAELAHRDYDLGTTYIDLLASKYRFVDLDSANHSATHKNRYPTATWWDNIIQNSREKIKLTTPREEPTMQRTETWLQKQVYPSIAQYIEFRAHQYNSSGIDYEEAHELARRDLVNFIVKHGKKSESKIQQIFANEES